MHDYLVVTIYEFMHQLLVVQLASEAYTQTASTRCVFKIYNVTRLAYIILHSLKFEIFSI